MASIEASQQPAQRYELVTTLGKGGMAEVFLGWMNSVGGLRRKVAIKRILPDLAKKQSRLFEQMFVDEARLAFQLEHDNIVRVYDVGQSANTFFIVMEYVEGMDLKRIFERLVESRRPMPLGVCLYLGVQVAAGLSYAHNLTDDEGQAMGLIHNDISPPNILVGRHGEVKIADFGLSDATSHDVVTPEGMVKGKFAYISPESTRDPSLVSSKSDIFSVGIVLWELLTAQRLFQKATDLETFQAVRNVVVPDIRKIRPDVPQELADVINRALAGDPKRRYNDAAELARDLYKTSYSQNIQLDRFGLIDLVNQLAGGSWTKFPAAAGSNQSMLLTLQSEMEGMLPPGVAAHLKTFVTNISVAQDVNESSEVQEDWLQDVFEDVGFDDEDLGPVEAEAPPVEEAAAPPSPAPAPPPRDPTPAPQQVQRSAPALPATSSNTEAVIAAMQAEMKSQRTTFIVYGAIAGLLLGLGFGFAIGMLL
ncbi:MAG: hypothetical protein CO108_05130 [Deltaproteobacteria bacterium CG_4_9_14_3_um_filter_63_12]|nr:MAG: hypothetical protein COW42_16440 [Deltaproteobacteria bacterium CG17_big_fil_post_rev_8_21_14_2_50_63_7]PJB46797.1 MAG: hypothetical protein CO108_05130 [Deltaproteobacteria bacterium CG_4_9_14_3_um_filter_63_12]